MQIQTVEARQSQPSVMKDTLKTLAAPSSDRRPSNASCKCLLRYTIRHHDEISLYWVGSPTSRRRKSVAPVAASVASEEELQVFRDAFQSIGFGLHGEPIDPEEIVGICMSYQELKQELDSKYREELERTSELRQFIVRFTSEHIFWTE